MKSWMVSTLVLIGVGYVGLCLYLYFMQRSMMYFPTPPAQGGAAEELSVASDGVTLRVWRLHGNHRDAILYFGGNAEDVAANIPDFSRWFPDFAVYLVNYRGYGGSTGSPTEQGLYRDAEAVFDRARAQHGQIAVIGRSLGAGVATHLASLRPVERLALVSPAASFAALARTLYPVVPTGLLLKDRYDSLARADRIEAPVLVLIAEDDRTVPPSQSQTLAKALERNTEVTVELIEGTDHNSIETSGRFSAALQGFFGAMKERPLSP